MTSCDICDLQRSPSSIFNEKNSHTFVTLTHTSTCLGTKSTQKKWILPKSTTQPVFGGPGSVKDSFFSTTSRSSESTSLKQFDLITLPQLMSFLGQHLFLSCDASRVVRVAHLKCEDTYQPSNDWQLLGIIKTTSHYSFRNAAVSSTYFI